MLYGIIGLVIGCVAGFLLGIWYRKSKAKEAEAKIANADEEALRIVNDAIKSAETKKKEMLLEAKEEILRSRSEYEKEEKSRRADLQRQYEELKAGFWKHGQFGSRRILSAFPGLRHSRYAQLLSELKEEYSKKRGDKE